VNTKAGKARLFLSLPSGDLKNSCCARLSSLSGHYELVRRSLTSKGRIVSNKGIAQAAATVDARKGFSFRSTNSLNPRYAMGTIFINERLMEKLSSSNSVMEVRST